MFSTSLSTPKTRIFSMPLASCFRHFSSTAPVLRESRGTVPRYSIELSEPEELRWEQVIRVYKDRILEANAVVDQALNSDSHGTTLGNFSGLAETVLSLASSSGLVLYNKELKSISKMTGLPLGRLTTLQLCYEAASACTSVTYQPPDPESGFSGLPVLARNMDWEMTFLKPLTVEVEFLRGGKPVALGTTWAGYVGLFTGLAFRQEEREERRTCENFGLSVNFRMTQDGSYVDNLKKTISRSWPIGFLTREVLTDPTLAPDYRSAHSVLRKAPLISPTYFTICGSKPYEGSLITRGRDRAIDIVELSDSATSKKDHTLICNMDYWESDSSDINIMTMSRPRMDCASASIRNLKHKKTPVTAADMWKLLETPPVLNDVSLYGTVMVPGLESYESRVVHETPAHGFVVEKK